LYSLHLWFTVYASANLFIVDF